MLLLIRYTNTSNQPAPSPQVNIQQVKTYTITQPVSQNILPDTGYDAMANVLLEYAVPEPLPPIPNYQQKVVNISNNVLGMEVVADQGYDALSKVTINTNVPGTIIQEISCRIYQFGLNASNFTNIVDQNVLWTVYDPTNQPLISPGSTIVAFCYPQDNSELQIEVESNTNGSANGYVYVPNNYQYFSNICYLIFNIDNVYQLNFRDVNNGNIDLFKVRTVENVNSDGTIIKKRASVDVFNNEIIYPLYSELYKA